MDSVVILPFLPLFSLEGNDYITNIELLPRSITGNVCHSTVELFCTSCTATVKTESIVGIAFIFLLEQLEKFYYHVQGICNAYVICFKFCGRSRRLLPLTEKLFHGFPDLSVHYQRYWSECYVRTIYSSLDHLRQEFWRFLCRYGQSQGLYPKQTLSFFPRLLSLAMFAIF
jgi:hypothetical protein